MTGPASGLTSGPASGSVSGRRGTRTDARFSRLLAAEWTKLVSLRSTVATIALTVAAAWGLAALGGAAQGTAYATLSPADRAAFDPTYATLLGPAVVVQLCVGVLGALVITSEYATRSILSTLVVAPVRHRVLAAKLVLTAVLGLVVGQICAVGGFLISQRMLAGRGAPHAGLGDPHVLRAVIGAGLFVMLSTLLGLAVGCLLRATAGAVAVLTAVGVVIPAMNGLLPDVLARWWPTSAAWQVMRVVPVDGGIAPLAGLADLAVTVAVVTAAAFVTLHRRDA